MTMATEQICHKHNAERWAIAQKPPQLAHVHVVRKAQHTRRKALQVADAFSKIQITFSDKHSDSRQRKSR